MSIEINRLEEGHNSYPLVYKNSLKITKKYSEERQTMKWPELRRINLSIIYFFLGIGNGS
jgi:hypothetical protein